jgi:hypothetical protein
MKIVEHTAGPVPGPGLYRMPAALYHADPAPEPSLSSSVAKILVEQSPEHAYLAHPRLGGQVEAGDPSRPMEIGTAAHKLILRHGRDIVVIDAEDYRTKDAKAQRAEAYAAGHAPILRPDLDKAEALAGRIGARLADIHDCQGFGTAETELVAIVRDRSGAWLRIMMDGFELRGRHAVVWDVKTSDSSAAPQEIGRRIQQMSMEVQAAFYIRVVELLMPALSGRTTFRWVFGENDPPNAVTVAQADGTALHVGQRKLALALHRWNACLKDGKWPGYPTEIIRADYPEWAARRWEEREGTDPTVAGVDWSLATSPFRPLDVERAA